MNFVDVLADRINADLTLPVKMIKSYLGASQSLVVYPLPGGQETKGYMDGSTDISLNYEIAMKSKEPDVLSNVLWQVSDYIERLTTLESTEFDFGNIAITSKPYITDADEQGWFVFVLDFVAKITTKNGGI